MFTHSRLHKTFNKAFFGDLRKDVFLDKPDLGALFQSRVFEGKDLNLTGDFKKDLDVLKGKKVVYKSASGNSIEVLVDKKWEGEGDGVIVKDGNKQFALSYERFWKGIGRGELPTPLRMGGKTTTTDRVIAGIAAATLGMGAMNTALAAGDNLKQTTALSGNMTKAPEVKSNKKAPVIKKGKDGRYSVTFSTPYTDADNNRNIQGNATVQPIRFDVPQTLQEQQSFKGSFLIPEGQKNILVRLSAHDAGKHGVYFKEGEVLKLTGNKKLIGSDLRAEVIRKDGTKVWATMVKGAKTLLARVDNNAQQVLAQTPKDAFLKTSKPMSMRIEIPDEAFVASNDTSGDMPIPAETFIAQRDVLLDQAVQATQTVKHITAKNAELDLLASLESKVKSALGSLFSFFDSGSKAEAIQVADASDMEKPISSPTPRPTGPTLPTITAEKYAVDESLINGNRNVKNETPLVNASAKSFTSGGDMLPRTAESSEVKSWEDRAQTLALNTVSNPNNLNLHSDKTGASLSYSDDKTLVQANLKSTGSISSGEMTLGYSQGSKPGDMGMGAFANLSYNDTNKAVAKYGLGIMPNIKMGNDTRVGVNMFHAFKQEGEILDGVQGPLAGLAQNASAYGLKLTGIGGKIEQNFTGLNLHFQGNTFKVDRDGRTIGEDLSSRRVNQFTASASGDFAGFPFQAKLDSLAGKEKGSAAVTNVKGSVGDIGFSASQYKNVPATGYLPAAQVPVAVGNGLFQSDAKMPGMNYNTVPVISPSELVTRTSLGLNMQNPWTKNGRMGFTHEQTKTAYNQSLHTTSVHFGENGKDWKLTAGARTGVSYTDTNAKGFGYFTEASVGKSFTHMEKNDTRFMAGLVWNGGKERVNSNIFSSLRQNDNAPIITAAPAVQEKPANINNISVDYNNVTGRFPEFYTQVNEVMFKYDHTINKPLDQNALEQLKIYRNNLPSVAQFENDRAIMDQVLQAKNVDGKTQYIFTSDDFKDLKSLQGKVSPQTTLVLGAAYLGGAFTPIAQGVLNLKNAGTQGSQAEANALKVERTYYAQNKDAFQLKNEADKRMLKHADRVLIDSQLISAINTILIEDFDAILVTILAADPAKNYKPLLKHYESVLENKKSLESILGQEGMLIFDYEMSKLNKLPDSVNKNDLITIGTLRAYQRAFLLNGNKTAQIGVNPVYMARLKKLVDINNPLFQQKISQMTDDFILAVGLINEKLDNTMSSSKYFIPLGLDIFPEPSKIEKRRNFGLASLIFNDANVLWGIWGNDVLKLPVITGLATGFEKINWEVGAAAAAVLGGLALAGGSGGGSGTGAPAVAPNVCSAQISWPVVNGTTFNIGQSIPAATPTCPANRLTYSVLTVLPAGMNFSANQRAFIGAAPAAPTAMIVRVTERLPNDNTVVTTKDISIVVQ